MKNYIGSILIIGATATCAESRIEPAAPVTIISTIPQPGLSAIPEEKTPDSSKQIEPLVMITDEMRWRLHNLAGCHRTNWENCGCEVNDLFFKLAAKIPKDEDRKCREDGDYEPGCVENVYIKYIGNDALLREYEAKEVACRKNYAQCTNAAEQNCNKDCWEKIKAELKKEQPGH